MKKPNLSERFDKIDIQILELLTENHSNMHISKTLRIPLSTIQRRVRKLIGKGFVTSRNYIDFTKFGFKLGSLHIYLKNGNVNSILDKVSKLKGVISLEVHIGNLDIIAKVVYNQGLDLLDLITNIKNMEGIDRIVWSERILEYPITSNNISLLELEPLIDS